MRLATLLQLLKPEPSVDDARAIAAYVQSEQRWLTYTSQWGRSIPEHEPKVLSDLREAFPQFTWTTRVTWDDIGSGYVEIDVTSPSSGNEPKEGGSQ